MPSLTTRPATSRNNDADRYSPDTAAAFTVGETRRDATRKSDVVRIAATPRTPTNRVTSSPGMIEAVITVPPAPQPHAPRRVRTRAKQAPRRVPGHPDGVQLGSGVEQQRQAEQQPECAQGGP